LNTAEIHGVAYEEPIAVDRAFFNQGQNAKYEPQTYKDGTNPTLVAKGPSAVCYGINGEKAGTLDASYYKGCGMRQGTERDVVAYWDGSQTAGTLTANNAGGSQRMPDKENFNCVIHTKPHYIVRRLTPTECARLQGFPDQWGHIDHKDDFTDEEYEFWLNVRNTHAEINGRQVKDYTKKQMLAWYNKLHTDSAEYKMYGNGVALPCVLYVMQGIQDAINKNERK
jgi:DNA (cytosine-5)-methyltransferase 1